MSHPDRFSSVEQDPLSVVNDRGIPLGVTVGPKYGLTHEPLSQAEASKGTKILKTELNAIFPRASIQTRLLAIAQSVLSDPEQRVAAYAQQTEVYHRIEESPYPRARENGLIPAERDGDRGDGIGEQLGINTTDAWDAILHGIHARYEDMPQAVPLLMAQLVEEVMQQRQLPAYVALNEMSQYIFVCLQNKQEVPGASPIPSTVRERLHTLFSSPVVMSRTDASALGVLYQLGRRPYSEAELREAQRLLVENPLLARAMVLFHDVITEHLRDYMEERFHRTTTFEAEGRRFSSPVSQKPLETFAIAYQPSDREQAGDHVIMPNPRFLHSMATNLVPSISIISRASKEAALTPASIEQGIQQAREIGVFKRYIAQFASDGQGNAVWSGVLFSTCPADLIVTECASFMVPKIYEHLQGEQKSLED